MIGESVYNCVGKTLWNVSGEAWRALPEAGMAAAVHVVRSGHDLVRETGRMVSRWRPCCGDCVSAGGMRTTF